MLPRETLYNYKIEELNKILYVELPDRTKLQAKCMHSLIMKRLEFLTHILTTYPNSEPDFKELLIAIKHERLLREHLNKYPEQSSTVMPSRTTPKDQTVRLHTTPKSPEVPMIRKGGKSGQPWSCVNSNAQPQTTTLAEPPKVAKTGKKWPQAEAKQTTPVNKTPKATKTHRSNKDKTYNSTLKKARTQTMPEPPPLPTAEGLFSTEFPDEGLAPSCFSTETHDQQSTYANNPFPFFSSNEEDFYPFEQALETEQNVGDEFDINNLFR